MMMCVCMYVCRRSERLAELHESSSEEEESEEEEDDDEEEEEEVRMTRKGCPTVGCGEYVGRYGWMDGWVWYVRISRSCLYVSYLCMYVRMYVCMYVCI